MAFCAKVLTAVLLISGVLAVPTPVIETNEAVAISDENSGWSSAASIIQNCDGKDLVACVGAKAVGYLDRASRMGNFEIYDGIVLVGNVDRSGRAMTENEIETDIQTAPDGKATRLLDLIAESVSRFFKTHYMEFKMPESLQESIDEARKKKIKPKFPKKMFRRIFPVILVIKAYLSALFAKLGVFFIGKLALKAAILAKIALGIGAYLLYRSRSSSSSTVTEEHHSHHAPEASYQPQQTSGWGPYQRSIGNAHELAFAGQVPEHLKSE